MAVNAYSVHAEVRVEGNARAVRIEANQSSVADVLTALSPAFNVRYRTATPLQGVVDGTFTGTIEQVIQKVLDGYNYVLKKEQNSIELIVHGTRGTRAVVIEPPKAPAAESLAKQWRTPIDRAKAQNP